MSATLSQPYIFFAFMYAGIISGFVYTLLEIIKNKSAFKKKGTVICDLIFFSLTALLVFRAFTDINSIQIRAYPFLGIICGYILQRLGFGRLMKIQKL